MKRIILLLAIAVLAVSVLAGCGSDKKEGKGGIGTVTAIDGGYVGTATCLGCHDGSVASDKREFTKSAHPYKYTHTGGAVMGTSTLPGLHTKPVASTSDLNTSTLNSLWVSDGTGLLDWTAANYVVGGFGWKIRWGIRDFGQDNGLFTPNPAGNDTGYIWAGPKAQFNLWGVNDAATGALAKWSAYNSGANKKYECAICHNTNGIVSTAGYSCRTDGGTDAAPVRTQPWANNPGMGPETHGGYYSSWTFDGVQCEGCHGPGVNHVTSNAKLSVLELPGGVEICAKCHIRAENTAGVGAECGGDANPKILTNGARISGDFIQHHESYNELVGYNNDGVHASLKCTVCHDPHKRSIKVTDAVAGLYNITDNDLSARARGAIKVSCVTSGCHAGKQVKTPQMQNAHSGLDCSDCHMAEATKTAINSSTAGWGRKGDLKTHIFRINTSPTATTITRTNGDGIAIATNYITVKYACGKCHDSNINPGTGTPMDEATAQANAAGYHTP
jgi:hypothetical protein